MKRRFLIIICLFLGNKIWAQSPRAIETDLLKDFKELNADHGTANDVFAKKLKAYTSNSPSTISWPFDSLVKYGLSISNSDDGVFRIYSWDTSTGGTVHFFENIFQYKEGSKTNSVYTPLKGDGDNQPNYQRVYTLRTTCKTYYLAVSRSIGSSIDVGQGIQVFAIERGKLNNDVKLIKTTSGIHSELHINYDLGSVIDWKVRPIIIYNSATQTISLPLVNNNGVVTHKFIYYKFNGAYFEKVKS